MIAAYDFVEFICMLGLRGYQFDMPAVGHSMRWGSAGNTWKVLSRGSVCHRGRVLDGIENVAERWKSGAGQKKLLSHSAGSRHARVVSPHGKAAPARLPIACTAKGAGKQRGGANAHITCRRSTRQSRFGRGASSSSTSR